MTVAQWIACVVCGVISVLYLWAGVWIAGHFGLPLALTLAFCATTTGCAVMVLSRPETVYSQNTVVVDDE
jgi:hypothetical protein